MKKKKFSVRDIVIVALMAALTFVCTFIKFDIPTPIGKTMIHLGNVMCLLSALLFGPLKGGLSAGMGSMMYDLFDPVYISESWVTFINKFMMALVAGLIYHKVKVKTVDGEKPKWLSIVAAVSGSLTYVILYNLKQIVFKYLIAGEVWEAVAAGLAIKLPISLLNGVIASICSVLLNIAMRPALKKAGLYDRINVR